jgi:hypothetical protein
MSSEKKCQSVIERDGLVIRCNGDAEHDGYHTGTTRDHTGESGTVVRHYTWKHGINQPVSGESDDR